MRTLAVFNGPPGCGKDEIVNWLLGANVEGNIPDAAIIKRSFKTYIIRIASDILGISEEQFLDGYNDLTEDRNIEERLHAINMERRYKRRYKRYKEVPIYQVAGNWYSKRSWLIHVSENIVKKSFGEDAFGKMFELDLPDRGMIISPDSGFADELKPSINTMGADNVIVIRINREGYKYEGDGERDDDSRRYLTPEDFDGEVKVYDVLNEEGDLSVMRSAVMGILNRHHFEKLEEA